MTTPCKIYLQSFVITLVISPKSWKIIGATKNCDAFLGSPTACLNKPIDAVFSTRTVRAIKKIKNDNEEIYINVQLDNGANADIFPANLVRKANKVYLEIASTPHDTHSPNIDDMYHATKEIDTINSHADLFRATLRIFKEKTHYDSIVAISFLEEAPELVAALPKKGLDPHRVQSDFGCIKDIFDCSDLTRSSAYNPDIGAKKVQLLTNSQSIDTSTLLAKPSPPKLLTLLKKFKKSALAIFALIHGDELLGAIICMNHTPKQVHISQRKFLLVLSQFVAAKWNLLIHNKILAQEQSIKEYLLRAAQKINSISSPFTLLQKIAQSISVKLKACGYQIYYADKYSEKKRRDTCTFLSHSALKQSPGRVRVLEMPTDTLRYVVIALNKQSSNCIVIILDDKNTYENKQLLFISKQVRLLLVERLMTLYYFDKSIKDQLTGLYNRAYLNEYYTLLKKQSRRNKQSDNLCLCMIDCDHFKDINDQHGHDAGDKVLIDLAEFLKTSFRGTDIIARFGGEEFVVLMPDTQLDSAYEKCNATLNSYMKRRIDIGKPKPIHMTFSAGISSTGGKSNMNLETLTKAADKALYQAKEQGRKQVCKAS